MSTQDNEPVSRDDKTRQRIISYCWRVISERGFRKVTIEELCAGMALSKRTFYKHFANRDALVEALLTEILLPKMQMLYVNLLSDDPVRTVIERHFDLLQTEVFPVLSLRLMSDIQDMMPELWEQAVQGRATAIELLSKTLERGQAQGVVRPEINTDVLSRVVQRIVISVADPHFVLSQGLSMQDLVTTMRQVVLNGLLVPDQDKEQKR
ncbi:MAG: TetR/AcrR family transcriptional regulator [Candidatus Alcyoniella australis]|nr:TetR/AcrR family transcriptional regulator [Candidatus Alcyoniella australis]